MSKVWKICPSFNGYVASSDGEVATFGGNMVNQYPHDLGYLTCCLKMPDGVVKPGVHRVIADAFHGPAPDGMDVDHIDHNKRNNTPGNLRYVSHAKNMRHAAANGRFPVRKGMKRSEWCRKDFTPRPRGPAPAGRVRPSIQQLVSMRDSGMTIKQIAEAVNYSWVWTQRALRNVEVPA
jgi:hypothetical protein